jgi:hypothetical protein
MSDAKLIPQPGDVWIGEDGDVRFVWTQKPDGHFNNMRWTSVAGKSDFVAGFDWWKTAERVFPPTVLVQVCDVIAVECAVFCHDDNSLMVDGRSYRTADETEENRPDQRCVATVTVNVPKSLLSPAVLPDVRVSEENKL